MVGLMIGFALGFLAFEQVAVNQPQRRPAGTLLPGETVAPPTPPGQAAAPAAPPASGAGSAGMAAMQQVQQLRQYVEENPEDAQALRTLANMNYDIQNWSRAAELYERFLGLQPGDTDIMTDLGISYRNLGRPQDALEQFRQIQAAKPENWQAQYNEILVLAFDLRDFPAAQAVLTELQAQVPDNPDVARLAQEIQRQMGS